MSDFRVSFTRVTLEYFEVDVRDVTNPVFAEGIAKKEVIENKLKYQLGSTQHALITTSVREL